MDQKYLWIEALKFNDRGLIPAIAQDDQDGTILMMAWMNKESIKQTLVTGEAHYWSRSRSQLWHKGATFGHIQKVKQIFYDCDADTILLKIEQIGEIACHTGVRSCFFNSVALPLRAYNFSAPVVSIAAKSYSYDSSFPAESKFPETD
jgi:phosphoribosyl-AMP cyclohydrolase